MTKLRTILVTSFVASIAGALPVSAVELGDTLATLQLPDQHDKLHAVGEGTRLVLLASSHDAARLVDAAIKDRPAGYLEQRAAIYVADISRVPGLVAKMVLVPSMRSASYRVLLDREGEVASERTGAEPVLWMRLDEGRVTDIAEFTEPAALRAALEKASP